MEERLKFVASGTKPRKNKDAMAAVLNELKEEGLFYGDNKKAVGKNSGAGGDAEMETDEDEAPKKGKKDKKAAKKEKKEKKEKKSKKEESAGKKRKRSKVDSDDEQDDDSD